MKKFGLIFFTLFLLMSMLCPVWASDSVLRMVDSAELLTDAEETALRDKLDEISARQNMDVVIVTVDRTDERTVTEYADDYYDYNGYREDGILLLVSLYDREWSISTAGYGITAFTDAGLDYMAEKFTDDLSAGRYSDAFASFAELCGEFITQAKTDRPYDRGNLPKQPFHVFRTVLVSLGIGLAGAFFKTNSMKNQLKSVKSQTAASPYVKTGSMQVTESKEIFLYRQLGRVQRSQSSSGGSSTHTSSSGRTHGGTSGKF